MYGIFNGEKYGFFGKGRECIEEKKNKSETGSHTLGFRERRKKRTFANKHIFMISKKADIANRINDLTDNRRLF